MWCVAQEPGNQPPANDAGAAERGGDIGSRDAAPVDDAADAGPADAFIPDCSQDLVVDAACVHPPVNPQCDGGWCAIPAGCFVMGSPECEYGRGRDSEPQVQVTLTHAFSAQQHETTRAEWTATGLALPREPDAGGTFPCAQPDCPVLGVNLYESLHYANAVSTSRGLPTCYALNGCSGTPGDGMVCSSISQTGNNVYECKGYRIPTEAEWEYMARAGTKTAFYRGGIALGPFPPSTCESNPYLESSGWYCLNAGRAAHPVGQKDPNPWGLFDVLGNATEWVSDHFTGTGYGAGPLTDPGTVVRSFDPTKELGVTRGGGFIWFAANCRAANRLTAVPALAFRTDGLRLVRTLTFADAGAADALGD